MPAGSVHVTVVLAGLQVESEKNKHFINSYIYL